MGIIISKFRKKKGTLELLDEIDKKITKIEESQYAIRERQRRIVGTLVAYSITLYIAVIFVYYYYFTPAAIRENTLYFTPLIAFPIICWISKRIIAWYYTRKLKKDEKELSNMKDVKKKLVDEVMEKETYKVAKQILEKYAPEQLAKNGDTTKLMSTPVSALYSSNKSSQLAILRSEKIRSNQQLVPRSPITPAYQPIPATPFQIMQPRLPFPRPILSNDRTPFDKLVDMLIGDGPNNRYALICKFCGSHNGMALKNEFEYIGYRCAYCIQWNPSRKQKPNAPNLNPRTIEFHEDSINDDIDAGSSCGGTEITEIINEEEQGDNKEDVKIEEKEEEESDGIEMEMKEINNEMSVTNSMENGNEKLDNMELMEETSIITQTSND